MAIQFVPILKALAPLAAEAGTAALAFARKRNSAGEMKEHRSLQELEESILRISKVTAALAEQTKALAEQQAAINASLEKKVRASLFLAVAALGVAVTALVLVLRSSA